MKKGQGQKDWLSAGWIIAILVVGFFSIMLYSDWDAFKDGYNTGKAENESVEKTGNTPDENHDATMIEALQLSKERIEQNYKATKAQQEPTVESLDNVLTQLVAFKSELVDTRQLLRTSEGIKQIDDMATGMALMQKELTTVINEKEKSND